MGYGQWLIVCEGTKTEPNYFTGLLEYLYEKGGRDLSLLVEIRGIGRGAESLVRRAEDFFSVIETEYGRVRVPPSNVAVVFDKDAFGKGSFNHAIKLADRQRKEYPDIERYITAWSHESFELWIYLHFHYTDSGMSRRELAAKLTDIFRAGGVLSGRRSYSGGVTAGQNNPVGNTLSNRRSYSSGVKNRDTLFSDILKCGGSPAAALKNAERLSRTWQDDTKYADQNPRTEVWQLVKALAEDAGVDLQ